MGKRPLNLPFLGLQALLILIDCIAVAYVSPILVSFGYSPMRIGRVMTLAALAATLARPVWGYLNDHFACARQVTLLATAAGISCYCLLVFGGDARPAVTAVAVMGLNVTIVCMMNFVDAWALRLISEGMCSITAPPAPVGRCPLRWGLWSLAGQPPGGAFVREV